MIGKCVSMLVMVGISEFSNKGSECVWVSMCLFGRNSVVV